MKKKLLREFITLFELLTQAELILSGNTGELAREDPMDTQADIIAANTGIEKIHRTESPFLQDLFDEVNDNLYEHPLNQREYVEDILLSFKDLASFIDEEEFYQEVDELDWLDHRYTNYGATCKLFSRWAENVERYSIDHYSVIEQYVLNCYFLMYTFFSFLDARCVHFKLDLMQIQKEMNIYLNRRRYVDDLVDAGYACKLKQLGIVDEHAKKALPENTATMKALPSSEELKDNDFSDWLQHGDGDALAALCKTIFDVKHRPKDYAIMTSLLRLNKFIDLHESHRRPFYQSWYTFIGKAFPKNNNYHSINKHMEPYSFGFINDTDPEYVILRRKFEKGLQGLKNGNTV